MKCYREGGCGPYEMFSCADCPASRPEYAKGNQKVKTNADWYRSMTDERLAEALADAVYYGPTDRTIRDRNEAVQLWLEWLKRAHKEEP